MKKGILLIFIVVLSIAKGFSIDSLNVVLKNPQKTIESHFKYLQQDNFHPELSINTFNWVGTHLTSEEKEKIAIYTKQIFDGDNIIIEIKKIPNKSNYVDDERNGEHVYIIHQSLPLIYLEKVRGKWLYSSETVKNIPKIFKEKYPYGLHKLFDLTLELDHSKTYFGLYIYQLIGLLILITLAFVVHKILSFILLRVFVGLIARFGRLRLAANYIKPAAVPLSYLIVFYLVSLFIPLLTPVSASHYILPVFGATLPFFGMLMVYKLVDVLIAYLKKMAAKTDNTLDDQLVPLLGKILKIFIVAVGFIFILDNFDFDVTALITGLGIGGLALALAAQDMLKNFFGSIMIFLDRPFQVGDWIIGNGIDGDIEKVGFRSTRVRTFHNSQIYVPNGKLADMTIDNYGMRKYRRYKTFLSVTYDTPPALIDKFVEGLREIVKEHPNTRKDYYNIYCNEFAASSIDVLFYIFFDVPSWPDELNARHEINLKIVELAEKLGVSFAFPTQTIHVEEISNKK